MWMNEYDIESALSRYNEHETPNLVHGVRVLYRLMNWTNDHSDGWPYWKKPANAAKSLMDLIQSVDRFDPKDVTEAQLKSALRPIKAFLTRQNVTHSEVML